MNKEFLNNLKQLDLLVVDDNPNYLDNICGALKEFFNKIYRTTTYQEAVNFIPNRPHIALFDIELDEDSGIELAKEFQKESPQSQIIFVSGFSDKEYLLSAIKLNVVDYIIKPATLPLLFESFEKVINNLGKEFFKELVLGDGIVFNRASERLSNESNEISLGAKERKLLTLFIANIGRVVKKEEIEQTVWPYSYMSDSALKNLLLELRKKIGKERIKNVPGAGWTLVIESF